jgi:hypothetical protein
MTDEQRFMEKDHEQAERFKRERDEARERADRLVDRVKALCDEGPGSVLSPAYGYVSINRLRAALSAAETSDD